MDYAFQVVRTQTQKTEEKKKDFMIGMPQATQ